MRGKIEVRSQDFRKNRERSFLGGLYRDWRTRRHGCPWGRNRLTERAGRGGGGGAVVIGVCCFSHSTYWLPTRKKTYFTRWPIPLAVRSSE